MLFNLSRNKGRKNQEDLIVEVAAIVLFAGAVLILDEVFLWNLSNFYLVGFSIIAGVAGYFAARISKNAIKSIPIIVTLTVAFIAGKELYSDYSWPKERAIIIESFLAKTDNCKAFDAQLVYLDDSAPICIRSDIHNKKMDCDHLVDNEWNCPSFAADYFVEELIAMPDWPSTLMPVFEEKKLEVVIENYKS